MPSFDLIHSKEYDREVSLVAFDLLELDGEAVARRPLLDRKIRLQKLVAKVRDASSSTSTSRATAQSLSCTPATCGMRASSRNGKTCPTNPAGRSGG